MSTYTVINGNDSGPGSLRDATLQANSNPGSTIIFDPSVTLVSITGSAMFIVNTSVIIIGNGASNLNITRTSGTGSIFAVSITTISISNLTISNGITGSDSGGGAILIQNSTLNLEYCVITNNSARLVGGGLSAFRTNVTIDNCTFNNNLLTATGAGGGGISCANGTLILKNSTVNNNSVLVGSGGGGIILSSVPSALIFNSTFYGNSVPSGIGGGIASSSSNVTLTNITVSGNNARGGGGCDFIINSTVTTVNNSIVANNTVTGSNPDVGFAIIAGSFTSAGNNLIGIDDNGYFINGVNGDKVGSTATPLNPQLGTLQNNGGFTQTLALIQGSPAIDSGNNANLPVGTLYDQRGVGFPRIVGGTVPRKNAVKLHF